MIERAAQLERALKRSGGRAVVLIHPRYHEYHPELYHNDLPVVDGFGGQFLGVQKEILSKSKLPVIVFEEYSALKRTRRSLPGVFFVPTEQKGVEPARPGGWGALLSYLKGRGLKHVIVGGQVLVKNIPREDFSPEAGAAGCFVEHGRNLRRNLSGVERYATFPISGCVGIAIANFVGHNIKVSILQNAIHPHKLELIPKKSLRSL